MKLLDNIFSSLKSRFVLMIGDEGAVLVYMENGVVVRRLFAPSSSTDHILSFDELFKAHPQTPIYVLVDMMDQSYVRHALPPVTQLSLGKLVQRRLDRDFSKDDITGSLNLGRETEGRRDWNFLLISLSYSDNLKGWLNLIYELPNRFSGIYLVPVETENFIQQLDVALDASNQRIIEEAPPPQALPAETPEAPPQSEEPSPEKKKKKPSLGSISIGKRKKAADEGKEQQQTSKSQWQMLVCHNKVGGVRQVVLKNQRLIFTRLTQALNESQPEVLAGNIEQEVLNTIEYLKRLSYNPKTGLDVYIILSQEVKSFISTLRFGATNIHVLTPFEAAELLNLKQAVLSGDRFSDVVLATSFGVSRKPRLRLNSNYSARIQKLESGQMLMRATAAATITALIGYVGYGFLSMQNLSGTNKDLQRSKRTHEENLTNLKEISKQLPADVDEVVDMTFFYEILSEKNYTLLDFIKDVSSVVDDDSLVQSLRWNASKMINPIPENKSGQQLQVSFDMELVYRDENWDAFQARYEALAKKIQDLFPNYEVKHSPLPGTYRTSDNLRVNFEDLESQRAGPPQGEVFNVTIDISGPVENKAGNNSRSDLLPPPGTAPLQLAWGGGE